MWQRMIGRLVLSLLASLPLIGCTPEHAVKTGEDLAAHSRLTDSVVIRRSTQRVLSRQAQLCLVSNAADTDAGLAVLRNMQAALSGYFIAVGVEARALDYSAALQQLPCPGANYLFFVQPLDSCKSSAEGCNKNNVTELLITVLNAENSGLADRITLTLKRNWLSLARDAQTDQRAAFDELARALSGADAP